MKNSFVNIEKYRSDILGLQKTTQSTETVNADCTGTDEDTYDFPASPHIIVKSTDLKGRKKYSVDDDFKIIKYLINHGRYSETGGNTIWKFMQAVQVTDHTSQSMKARFKKIILPNIESYDIPAQWKAKLTGNYKKNLQGSSESDSECEMNSSFRDLEAWKEQEQSSCNKKLSDKETINVLKDGPAKPSSYNKKVVDKETNILMDSSPKRSPKPNEERPCCSRLTRELTTSKLTTPNSPLLKRKKVSEGESSEVDDATCKDYLCEDEIDQLIISKAKKQKMPLEFSATKHCKSSPTTSIQNEAGESEFVHPRRVHKMDSKDKNIEQPSLSATTSKVKKDKFTTKQKNRYFKTYLTQERKLTATEASLLIRSCKGDGLLAACLI
ncbi:uncharacterized protein LOC131956058 isoform X2 [Physella acuta]|nr:uncharacterized protein LOC131956058 isoform X2 [Physella acuta]